MPNVAKMFVRPLETSALLYPVMYVVRLAGGTCTRTGMVASSHWLTILIHALTVNQNWPECVYVCSTVELAPGITVSSSESPNCQRISSMTLSVVVTENWCENPAYN